MTYLLFGFGFLILLYIGGRWAASARPAQILNAAKWIFLVLAVAIALAIVATGRWALLWTVGIAVLPWLLRLSTLLSRFKAVSGFGRNSGGGANPASEIETALILVWLDHSSGQMDGRVRTGAFEGKRLSDLTLPELLSLRAEAQVEDRRTVPILETFLDRTFPTWRDEASDEETPKDATDGHASHEKQDRARATAKKQIKTRGEALRILGLTDPVDDDAIRDAHRRLMKQAHPDVGGSDAEAALLNQAKAFLLGKA